jgi:hypothetical protein
MFFLHPGPDLAQPFDRLQGVPLLGLLACLSLVVGM